MCVYMCLLPPLSAMSSQRLEYCLHLNWQKPRKRYEEGKYTGCSYGYGEWPPYSGLRDCPVCKGPGTLTAAVGGAPAAAATALWPQPLPDHANSCTRLSWAT